MPRPREFDPEEVLDQGMQLLWARGYEATSLEDLLAAMKLSKSSFYETFGSKHELLMASLKRYIETVLGQLARDMEVGSARSAIARSFEFSLQRRGAAQPGCFLQNCAIELAARDPEAQQSVSEGLKRLEDGYYRAVLRGQEDGEFDGKEDPRALARFLLSSLNGLQVLAKAGINRSKLQQVADLTIKLLR